MKYLIILFLLSTTTAYAQNFSALIAKHREDYKTAFIKDQNSPLRQKDLHHLHFFEADSTYQITADVNILKNQKYFQMPTYNGSSKEFIRYAKVTFKLNGKDLELTLYRNIGLMVNPVYRNSLFLPFTDETTGELTYGGGRYIDLDIKDIKNNKIIIDFNKAYNPYCAYSDGYRCPIPPEENDLAVSISAGEKNYTGEKKHK